MNKPEGAVVGAVEMLVTGLRTPALHTPELMENAARMLEALLQYRNEMEALGISTLADRLESFIAEYKKANKTGMVALRFADLVMVFEDGQRRVQEMRKVQS